MRCAVTGGGRDPHRTVAVTGLAARLVALVAPLLAAGAAIGGALGGPGGALAGVAATAVLIVAAGAYGDRLALSALAARPVSEVTHAELYRLVRELCNTGRLPVPRLYVSPAEQPNSFTVGRSPRRAVICCTQGLLGSLDEAGLRGVLGHELAHVAGRDMLPATVSAALATVLTSPAALARSRPARGRARESTPDGLGPLEKTAMLLLGPAAALVIQLSVARRREYRADAAGALLSGDPVALASALRTIETGTDALALAPDARLTSVGHLMMASPFRAEGFARLFVTHPPAGERLRRLEALAGYRR
jgi:heat shock protein HtpX